MRKRISVAVALVGLLAFASLAQATVINFENYTLGDLAGQDGWTGGVSSVVATASGDPAQAGSQWISAYGSPQRTFTGSSDIGNVTNVSFLLKPNATGSYTDYYISVGSARLAYFGVDHNVGGWGRWYVYPAAGGSAFIRSSTEYNSIWQVNVALDFTAQNYDITVTDIATSASWSKLDQAFTGAVTLAAAQASGITFKIEALGGATHSNIDNITVGTIPEPSVIVLLASGLIGLLCYAWRKRK
jgi:hypothetical protein